MNPLLIALLALCTSTFGMQEAQEQQDLLTQQNKFWIYGKEQAASANNEYILGMKQRAATVYRTQNGKSLKKEFFTFENMTCAALSPDGMLGAVMVNTGVIRLWDVASGQLVDECQWKPGKPTYGQLKFSSSGTRLAVSDWGDIACWQLDPSSPKLDAPVLQKNKDQRNSRHVLFVNEDAIAYSAWDDERTQASISLVAITDTNERTTPLSNERIVNLANAHNKQHVLAAVDRKQVWLWNTQSETPARPFFQKKDMTAVAFEPNAHYLVTADRYPNYSLYLFALDPALTAATLIWQKKVDDHRWVVRLWWATDNSSLIHSERGGSAIHSTSKITLWKVNLPDNHREEEHEQN